MLTYKINFKFAKLRIHGLFKFSDELRIQESKLLWRWENKKIPKSLREIVTERHDNLRGRRFNISRNCKKIPLIP